MRVEKKIKLRQKRHLRIRRKISGTSQRPRLAVCFSGKNIYAQVIDDVAGKTIVSSSTISKDLAKDKPLGANIEGASVVGKVIAEKAKEKGIESVIFDRGGFRFHGKVKALAEAARENGLNF